MTDTKISDVIEAIQEVMDDSTVPRNVKNKLEGCADVLKNGKEEMPLRVDKVIQELTEIANDQNAQSYTRSQLWNILSILESN